MERMGHIKTSVYLPEPLSKRLDDEVARAPGVTKTGILAEALESWLNRKGASELELRFAKRLDRLSIQQARLERNDHVGLEALGLFVLYMLTVTPPVAADDEAARAVGRDRYKAFVERVGRKLATGRPSLLPDEEDEEQ